MIEKDPGRLRGVVADARGGVVVNTSQIRVGLDGRLVVEDPYVKCAIGIFDLPVKTGGSSGQQDGQSGDN